MEIATISDVLHHIPDSTDPQGSGAFKYVQFKVRERLVAISLPHYDTKTAYIYIHETRVAGTKYPVNLTFRYLYDTTTGSIELLPMELGHQNYEPSLTIEQVIEGFRASLLSKPS